MNSKITDQSKNKGNSEVPDDKLGSWAMPFGGCGLAVSERELAVSNPQIGYLGVTHRLRVTERTSSQLQSSPTNSSKTLVYPLCRARKVIEIDL